MMLALRLTMVFDRKPMAPPFNKAGLLLEIAMKVCDLQFERQPGAALFEY
ncbi:MAG: hypothetical protein JWO71_2717 [Candidatus Acidoferrum typicum]|nr:hypothetical protein [Candidatus Acidoferrum typicum]